ncbi:unnamed protein product [Amoebophrya sp. A120]|nr:unnamed protein product [Amoebophrya sp. A120]|eukprot:GSA120T00016804001.1
MFSASRRKGAVARVLLLGFLHTASNLPYACHAVIFNASQFLRRHCGPGPRRAEPWVVVDNDDTRQTNRRVVYSRLDPQYYPASDLQFNPGCVPGKVEVPHSGGLTFPDQIPAKEARVAEQLREVATAAAWNKRDRRAAGSSIWDPCNSCSSSCASFVTARSCASHEECSPSVMKVEQGHQRPCFIEEVQIQPQTQRSGGFLSCMSCFPASIGTSWPSSGGSATEISTPARLV